MYQEIKYIGDIDVLEKMGRIKRRSSKEELELGIKRRERINSERREQIIVLYNKGISSSEMAKMFGVTIFVIENDINFLFKAGRIVDKKEKEKSIRTKEEEMYYNSMIKSIKLFIQKGEFNNVIEYIKMLKAEVKLTRLEIEKLDKLVELIIVRLYKEKNSLEDISKKLNMDEDIVRRYIDNNYSIPERSQKTDNRGLEEEK